MQKAQEWYGDKIYSKAEGSPWAANPPEVDTFFRGATLPPANMGLCTDPCRNTTFLLERAFCWSSMLVGGRVVPLLGGALRDTRKPLKQFGGSLF